MSQEKKLQQLNENIPEICKKQILKIGEQNRQYTCVYRVAKTGEIAERAFLSTYDEIEKGYIPDDDEKYPKDKIGTYSTSVYTDRKMCDKFIHILKRGVRLRKTYPHPEILMGKTSNGIAQQTCMRESGYEDETHVDWWIYKDKKSEVLDDFCIVPR